MRLDRLVPIGIVLTLVALAAFGLAHAPAWFWHPLGYCPPSLGRAGVVQCKSYNAWSGSFSDLSEVTLIIGMISFAVGWWYKHNCHVPGCPRLGWHPHPEHGHPVCKPHHPHSDADHRTWAVHRGA